MKNAVIVESCRTAVGNMGGSLKPLSAADLACAVIRGCIDRSGIEPDEMETFSLRLFAWFPSAEPALAERLATGKKLDDETLGAVNAALARFAEAL